MTRRTVPQSVSPLAAFERVQPQLDELSDDALEPFRHEVPNAVVDVLGVALIAKKYRGQVSKEIGEDVAKHFDHLEDAARASLHAHVLHLIRGKGITVASMVEDLGQKRRVMLAEARSLVAQKKLTQSVLAELAGGTGQQALCVDALQLVAVFRTAWPEIASATSVTKQELADTETLASMLATTLGENEHGNTPVADVTDQRARAYTYLVQTYDEVRRAMHYIRWDLGDADSIVPSLSAGRTRHAVEAPASSEPITPIVPVTTVSSAGTLAAPAPETPAAPGTPSAQPFGSS